MPSCSRCKVPTTGGIRSRSVVGDKLGIRVWLRHTITCMLFRRAKFCQRSWRCSHILPGRGSCCSCCCYSQCPWWIRCVVICCCYSCRRMKGLTAADCRQITANWREYSWSLNKKKNKTKNKTKQKKNILSKWNVSLGVAFDWSRILYLKISDGMFTGGWFYKKINW